MRRGDWMLTASRRKYWPIDPRPEDVCIEDIATHLGKECRYNGACDGFYSVAEHSVLVSHVVAPEYALQALLHDAPEAYIKDMPRPSKRGLGLAYEYLEEINWRAIATHFGLPFELHPSVKEADDAVLLAERDQILTGGDPWSVTGSPAAVRIAGYDWMTARALFLHRYAQITGDAA